jgi:hypothetical protein
MIVGGEGWTFVMHPLMGARLIELPPSEWSIDYDRLDRERDDECEQEAQAGRDHREAA